jgi:HSP20 family protein
MTMTSQRQTVPVQVHQADDLMVLAAPMPGLEPEDISLCISGARITIHGDYRGSRQDQPEVLISEWTIGPYYREVILPEAVNGELANATYGNGVLVLSMPLLKSDQPSGVTEFRLKAVDNTSGQHIGHTGSARKPATDRSRGRKKGRASQQSAH